MIVDNRSQSWNISAMTIPTVFLNINPSLYVHVKYDPFFKFYYTFAT